MLNPFDESYDAFEVQFFWRQNKRQNMTRMKHHPSSVVQWEIKWNYTRTRRLAACTQAVIILRSTSYIAIELKCSAFEVVRNSIEWVKIVISAYERFSLFSLAFAVVCLFFHFSNKRDILNFRVMAVRDIELPWAL